MAPRRPSRPPRSPRPRRGTSAYNYTIKPLPPENGYSVSILSPVNGATLETKRPTIKVSVSSILGDPVDVQVEWRTQMPYLWPSNPNPYNPEHWRPYPPTQASEYLSVASGSTLDIQPPNDLTNTSWYYRVRAGNKTLNVWTQYTPAARFLNVIPVLGSTSAYLDWNVGVINDDTINATAYMDFNVGLGTFDNQDGVGYLDFNVGVIPEWEAVAGYLDMNVYPPVVYQDGARYLDMNVTATRPNPTIWWIRPEQGREGYVFHIYGHGFGSFKNLYDGQVYLGTLICQVTRWVLVPRQILLSEVRASGTRSSAPPSAQNPPRMTYNNVDTVVLAAGDTIEFDQRWDTSGGVALSIVPGMWYSNVNPAVAGWVLNDVNGVPWAGAPAGLGTGAWVHRKFTIPPSGTGSNWVNAPASNFGMMWLGSGANLEGGAIRSFVIKNSAGDVKLWATNDDKHLGATVPIGYTSIGGSALASTENIQESDRIVHGQGLDPDEITVEHGWITVVVPNGAVSAMVKVVLEGGSL